MTDISQRLKFIREAERLKNVLGVRIPPKGGRKALPNTLGASAC
jgi:hypothetical protein